MNRDGTTFQEQLIVKMCDLTGAHEPRETSPPVGLEPTTYDLRGMNGNHSGKRDVCRLVGYDILSTPTKMRFLPRGWSRNNIPRARSL